MELIIGLLVFIYIAVMLRITILQLGVLKYVCKDEELPREIKYKIFRRILLAIFFWPRDFFAIPLIFFKAYALADKVSGVQVGMYYSQDQ